METLTAIPQSTAEFRRFCREQSDATATAHIALAPASANVWLDAMRQCMAIEGVPTAEINKVMTQAGTAIHTLHSLLRSMPDAWQEMANAIARIDHAATNARDNGAGTRFRVDA